MAARKGPRRFLLLLAVAIAAGAGLFVYQSRPSAAPEAPLIGAVRETEIHIAPDLTGRLQSVLVSAGQQVRKGDLLAVLSSPELTASVYEAGAAAGQARANRDNVFAGVRKEEIDIASDNVRTAEANVVLAKQQYDRAAALAAKSFMSKQQLDENTASMRKAEAALELARAIDARDKAGPTKEERESADANVLLAEAARASGSRSAIGQNKTSGAGGRSGSSVGRSAGRDHRARTIRDDHDHGRRKMVHVHGSGRTVSAGSRSVRKKR